MEIPFLLLHLGANPPAPFVVLLFRMHGELGVGEQEISHQRPVGVLPDLVAAVLHDQFPNPDGVEQAVFVQLPEGGGIFPQNIAIGAKILIYRPFCLEKKEVIHEIIFVVLDGGVHPFRQSGEQLPAVQLGTQAGLDLPAVQQIPQTGQIVLLPSREVPENTEGYEGFAHLNNMEGDVERAHLHYIIRDHDRDLLEARKNKFNLAAEFINRKYGLELVKVTLKDAYSNMKEMILPHQEILDVARAAMRKNGVEPVTTPIRGGTDGARLSFMGLPCPNLCTGGELAHGRNEFAVLEEMEAIVEIVKSIAELVE